MWSLHSSTGIACSPPVSEEQFGMGMFGWTGSAFHKMGSRVLTGSVGIKSIPSYVDSCNVFVSLVPSGKLCCLLVLQAVVCTFFCSFRAFDASV